MKKPTMLGIGVHYTQLIGSFNIGRTFITFSGKIKRYYEGADVYDYKFSAQFRIDEIQNIEFIS
jgi:hypothetical protein